LQRQTALRIIGVITISIVGAALMYSAYYNSFYRIDRANALLSRAETAGFAEDMISYLQRGRQLLPEAGNPVWWFPTDKTDFSEIQKDIDTIVARATLLESLPRDSAAYQQGMDDLRGKIKAMELQLAEASGYMFVSGWNLVISAIWLAVFAIILIFLKTR
jgi:hypothetical protein